MSTFAVPIEIGTADGRRWEHVGALVDTGSTYSWVPADLLRKLGIRPRLQREFVTADERVIRRDMGVGLARINDEELPTLIGFGEEGGTPLLGAATLEEFGLGVDPLGHGLVPSRAL